MAGVNQIIYGSDYNTVQLSARRVLGDGFLSGGDHGYGVTLASSLVPALSVITAAQWNNLIYDINRAYKHITGSNYTGYTSTATGNISYANLSYASDAIAYADTNRLTATEVTQTQVYTKSYTGTWGGGGTGLTTAFTITFASAEYARYFFNAGGRISLQGTYSYGSAVPQNDAWLSMMSQFSTFLNRAGWYNIQSVSAPFIVYQLTGGTAGVGAVYTNNYIWLTVTSISSTSITLSVKYQDDHVAQGVPDLGPDYVDGTIGFRVYQNNPDFSSYYPSIAYSSGY